MMCWDVPTLVSQNNSNSCLWLEVKQKHNEISSQQNSNGTKMIFVNIYWNLNGKQQISKTHSLPLSTGSCVVPGTENHRYTSPALEMKHRKCWTPNIAAQAPAQGNCLLPLHPVHSEEAVELRVTGLSRSSQFVASRDGTSILKFRFWVLNTSHYTQLDSFSDLLAA